MDFIVHSSQRLGFQLDLKLRAGSCWATAGRGGHARGIGGQRTASAPPADPPAYASFVAQVVDRYSPLGVHTWAIENEPNASTFWDGSAAEYGQLVRSAVTVIRAREPNATVLDGGVSSTGWGSAVAKHLLDTNEPDAAVRAWNAFFARRQATRSGDFPPSHNAAELQHDLTLPQDVRNLQFIAVTKGLIQDKVVDGLQVHFYERWDNVAALMAAARDVAGPSVPIEVWEAGRFFPDGPDRDPDASAETVKSAVLLLAGGARRVIWLPLLPNSGGQQSTPARSGLVTKSGKAAAAGDAFAALVPVTAGAAATAFTAPGVLGATFIRPGGTDIVLWSATPRSVIPGSAPPGALVTDIHGHSVNWPAGGLAVGPMPILIRLRAGTALTVGARG